MSSKEKHNESKCESECTSPKAATSSFGVLFEITPILRYAKKLTIVDKQVCRSELRLQQMWQGSDGSQRWEWVEEIE